jgi:very-short-patch-repair endonuclease
LRTGNTGPDAGESPSDGETIIARTAGGLLLHHELPGDGYALDFAFTHARVPLLRVGIDLDGRDFHGASWEQAERDRRRARQLLAVGWSVARFSGREVARTPMSCALEALRIVRPRAEAMGRGWPGPRRGSRW